MTRANKTAFVLACIALIFSTLAYGAVHQPILALFYIIVFALVLLLIFDGFTLWEVRIDRSRLQLPLLLIALYGLLQVVPFGHLPEIAGVTSIPRTISLDPFATQVSALHFLALFFFFAVLLALINSVDRIRRAVIVITVFGSVFAFFAILQSVLSPDKIYGIYETRFAVPFGSFVSRHNFAAFMEMSVAVPLGLVFTGAVQRDKRLLYATAIALMGIALFLSGSRGGLLAFLAEIIFLVVLTTRGRGAGALALKLTLLSLLLIAVVAGAWFVGGDTSLTRFSDTTVAQDVTTGRSHIWSVSLKIAREHLPFGAGLGAYGVAYTRHDTMSGLERVEQAHNDYLQVLTDAGVPGLLIGILFLFELFRAGVGAHKTENTYRRGVALGAFAGCFAVMIHSLFDFVLHTTAISLLFLFLLALLSASRRKYADDHEEHPTRRHRRAGGGVVKSIFAAKRVRIPDGRKPA